MPHLATKYFKKDWSDPRAASYLISACHDGDGVPAACGFAGGALLATARKRQSKFLPDRAKFTEEEAYERALNEAIEKYGDDAELQRAALLEKQAVNILHAGCRAGDQPSCDILDRR